MTTQRFHQARHWKKREDHWNWLRIQQESHLHVWQERWDSSRQKSQPCVIWMQIEVSGRTLRGRHESISIHLDRGWRKLHTPTPMNMTQFPSWMERYLRANELPGGLAGILRLCRSHRFLFWHNWVKLSCKSSRFRNPPPVKNHVRRVGEEDGNSWWTRRRKGWRESRTLSL